MPQDRRFAILASALSSGPRQSPPLARQAGFAGLLFDAITPAFSIADLSGTGRREFQRVLAAQDRQLVGFRMDLGAKGFGPGSDIDQLLSQLKKLLESAAALNAPLLCIELGRLPEPVRVTKHKPKVTPDMAGLILLPTSVAESPPEKPETAPSTFDAEFASQVDGAMTELGALADRCSAVIAFRSDLASFAALERVLVASRCPWFGIDLDPVAMLRDSWSSQDIFSQLGPLIRHVRARDAIIGADHRTKPATIGQGSVNWNEFLTDLDGTAYQGWLTLDSMEMADRVGAAVTGLRYLRTCQE